MKAPLPDNETQRLAILREYNVLDSMPEQAFDDLTLLAAQICQTPITLISLIDEDRQWFKSRVGLNAAETSRDAAFCAHAILNPDEVLEVPDAQLDPRFADNPLVTGDPHIRFYAGAPLVTADGLALGTLCVIDRVPRKLSAEQTAALQALSRTVVARLELRRTAQQRGKTLDSSHSGKKKWALESTTVAAFAAAILSLLIVGAISIRSLLLLGQQVDWVQHTQKIIEQANHMLANVVEVQSGTRGYLIMGADSYLATYNMARFALPQDVQNLRNLTADSPTQQQRLDVIEPLVEKRLDISRNLVELRQTQGFKIAQASMMLGQGQTVTDQIRQLHKEVVEEEQRLLTESNQKKDNRIRFTLMSIGTLGALSVIILGLTGVRIRREIIARSEAQARVETLNADLEFRAVELAAARHRAETSDRLKSAILKHAGHAIISTTPEGIITTFNPAAEQMLGYTAAEVVGLQSPAIIHEPTEVVARAQEFSTELGKTIAPGFEVFVAKTRLNLPNEYEWTYIRKDGSRLPVLLTITAFRDAAGEITGFLGLAADLSERKRAEQLLRAKNEELKTFAYTVSHDLKAPLRGIAGYAQELERRHKEGLADRAQFCITQIITATKNLDNLIEDLLKYSRLDTDTPTLSEVNLPDLVQSILRDRNLMLTELNVEVSSDIPPLTLTIWQRGLHQVLSNLIDNAIKYSRQAQPPRLTIRAIAAGGRCRVSVADNGIGFDMKYHDRIFGLFNRLVRADEFEGTGIGLAIVKKLMEKLGGTIRAEASLGEGATFFIEFPVQNEGRP